MAQTVDQIIRQQLGNLLVEVAALTAQLQERDETITKLKEQLDGKSDTRSAGPKAR